MERHLRNVLLQIEEQLRKQESEQRTIRVRHNRLKTDETQLKRDLKRLQRDLDETDTATRTYEEKEEHDSKAKETATQRLNEGREELQGVIKLGTFD